MTKASAIASTAASIAAKSCRRACTYVRSAAISDAQKLACTHFAARGATQTVRLGSRSDPAPTSLPGRAMALRGARDRRRPDRWLGRAGVRDWLRGGPAGRWTAQVTAVLAGGGLTFFEGCEIIVAPPYRSAHHQSDRNTGDGARRFLRWDGGALYPARQRAIRRPDVYGHSIIRRRGRCSAQPDQRPEIHHVRNSTRSKRLLIKL